MTDEDLNLANAIRYAHSVVKRWTRDGAIQIPELSDGFCRAQACFQTIQEKIGTEAPEFMGYRISEHDAVQLLHLFDSDPDAASLIRERLSTNVLFGTVMPKSASFLAYRIMQGDSGAIPKGRPNEDHRNTLLMATVSRIHARWGFNKAYNPKNVTRTPSTSPVPCCSEIVAACLRANGVDIKSDTAANIVYNNKRLEAIANDNDHLFFGTGQHVGILAALMDQPTPENDDRLSQVFDYFSITQQNN